MSFVKQISLAAIVAAIFMIFGTSQVSAQSQQNNSGVWDKISKAVQGESKENSFYNNRTRQNVKVTVKDLSWSDIATYSSVKEAFGTNWASSNLVVNDISLAPDFGAGYYMLSFSLPENETTKVVVLDVAGNEIHSETIEDFSGTYESKLSIAVTQKGTYFLKIIQGFSLLNKKLVIE